MFLQEEECPIYPNLGKSLQKSEHFRKSGEIQSFLLRTTVQGKVPLNAPLEITSSGKRRQRNVGEGSNKGTVSA